MRDLDGKKPRSPPRLVTPWLGSSVAPPLLEVQDHAGAHSLARDLGIRQ
jgi:hypothetical protein